MSKVDRTYLIFSSAKPRVSSTRPQRSSLNAIPFCVPPQALYNQSASTVGMPSDKTSCKNAFLLSVVPFDPADRLNASLMRRNSFSLTEMKKNKKKTFQFHIAYLRRVKINFY